MNDSGKLQTILDSLTDLLFTTWSAFLVANNLDLLIDNNDLTHVRYLIVSIQVSCVDSSLLGFSKLMSENKNEVTIGYLLNMCLKKPDVFSGVRQDDVVQTVKRHQEQIIELRSLEQQVKKWRDWAIAHLDRKNVNDPASVTKIRPVKMSEVGKGFIILQEIINVYRGWLDIGLLKLRDYEVEMNSEWEYLVGLLQRNSLNKG